MMTPNYTEKSLENWLKNQVKKRGGKYYKLTSITGLPDRLILLPKGRALFIELKKVGGKPSEIQRKRIKDLTDLDHIAAISSCKTELLQLLSED
jgi:hypothetical protein